MRTRVIAFAALLIGCATTQVSVQMGALSRRDVPDDALIVLGIVEGRHCNRLFHPANLREAVLDAETKIEGTDALVDALVTYETTARRDCFVVKGDAVRIGAPAD
jgi:hypothetical protein